MKLPDTDDIIAAIATPPGEGAIGVVRVSGAGCIAAVNSLFKGKNLNREAGYTLHFGKIYDNNEVLDEVLVSLFHAPNSYTGQESVEISCHGSGYILKRVLELLMAKGVRMAGPGEFTFRAFLNKKLDLAQAEAVADLIAAESAAQHKLAMQQMRGGFSNKLKILREQLINLTALLELELDFGEEDVEFADRTHLHQLLLDTEHELRTLSDSFSAGNAIKRGIPVVLAGKPNAGKSTLLNALVAENRAIVSNKAGTTRDVIEEFVTLRGLPLRFVDTAGIRQSEDEIEQMGIAKTMEYLGKATLVLYLFDPADTPKDALGAELERLKRPDALIIAIMNKVDCNSALIVSDYQAFLNLLGYQSVQISALTGKGLDELKATIFDTLTAQFHTAQNSEKVSNLRHYQELQAGLAAVLHAIEALNAGLDNVLVAHHLRDTLRSVGNITGEVEVDRDILGAIFSRFCIGK